MTVFVAGMVLRGPRADAPEGLRVNVTSAQPLAARDRLAFSPMHVHDQPFSMGDETFANFEGFWQSRKKLRGIPHDTSKRWWAIQKKARRRHPKMKTNGVEFAADPRFPGQCMDYVTSRRLLYVPDYHTRFLQGSQRVAELQNVAGNVIIFDFDGPFDGDTPACLPVTAEMLREKIADTSRPFGHGYVVAAAVAGIDLSEFV